MDQKPKKKPKRRKPLSRRSVQICRTVLGTILEDARKKKYIAANPMQDVATFPVPEPEVRLLPPPMVKLLCQLAGLFYGVMFLIMAFCGLRIGEVTGLKRTDFDLERRLLFVRRQVTWPPKRCPHKKKRCRRRGQNCPHGETECPRKTPSWQIKDPKTEAGIRVVEIPAPMVPLLVAHFETLNGRVNPLDLAFPNELGTPLYPRNVRRRHFAPIMKQLGIAGMTPHSLRRTFIAVNVEAKTHPKKIQARAGHSRIGTTMDIYAKLAGRMPLAEDEHDRLNDITRNALPAFTADMPKHCTEEKRNEN